MQAGTLVARGGLNRIHRRKLGSWIHGGRLGAQLAVFLQAVCTAGVWADPSRSRRSSAVEKNQTITSNRYSQALARIHRWTGQLQGKKGSGPGHRLSCTSSCKKKSVLYLIFINIFIHQCPRAPYKCRPRTGEGEAGSGKAAI